MPGVVFASATGPIVNDSARSYSIRVNFLINGASALDWVVGLGPAFVLCSFFRHRIEDCTQTTGTSECTVVDSFFSLLPIISTHCLQSSAVVVLAYSAQATERTKIL